MPRTYAVTLGLLALVVVIVRGVLAGAAPDATLRLAMLAMTALALVGAAVGGLSGRTMDEEVRARFAEELAQRQTTRNTPPAQRRAA